MIGCDKLVMSSPSGCVTPPPPVVHVMELAGGPREEDGDTDTPKTAMGGIMVDALNSKLQQLQEEMWNSEAPRQKPLDSGCFPLWGL